MWIITKTTDKSQVSHRQVQTTTGKVQTSHRGLQTSHRRVTVDYIQTTPEVFLNTFIKHYFQKGYGKSKK